MRLAGLALLAAVASLCAAHWRTVGGPTGNDPRLTVTRVHLDAAPVAVAAAGGHVWVVVETRASTARLIEPDAGSGTRVASYTIGRTGPDFGAVTATRDAVWATAGGHVLRIARGSAGVAARVATLPGEGAAITSGFGSVWVATIGTTHDEVIRLDASTLALERRIPLPAQPVALGRYLGSIWLASTGGLWRVTPTGDRVVPASDPAPLPVALAATAQALWIVEGDRRAVRLDRLGSVVDRLPLPFSPGAVAAAANHLWVTDNCGCRTGRLAVVDQSTRRVLSSTIIGGTPVGIADDGTGAWVTTFADETVSHVTLG